MGERPEPSLSESADLGLPSPPRPPWLAAHYDPVKLGQIAPEPPCHTDEEHEAIDRKQRQHVQEFIADLRARRLKPVAAYQISPTQFGQQQREAVRIYFRELKHKWPRRYRHFVTVYERAHENVWLRLPCQRGRLPLLPDAVDGLPANPRILPPQRGQGGRPDSPIVRDRNAAILEELKRFPTASPELAHALDHRGIAVPPEWRDDGLMTWAMACHKTNKRFRGCISRARQSSRPLGARKRKRSR
jgi:hypothetical protein